jgi:hypothetical protein
MHGEFNVEIDHKRRPCLQIMDEVLFTYNVKIMATVQNFELIINKFNLLGIFTTEVFIVCVLSMSVSRGFSYLSQD